MTGLALWNIGMLTTVAERTGKCLVLGYCLLHLFSHLFVAWDTECSRRGQGIVDLQWMMDRMTAKAVTGHLALGMWFMAPGTVRDLTVHLMAEGTGLLGMGTFIVGKILSRTLMTGQAWLFYIIGKIERQRLMRVGMTGKAVFQFKVRRALMAHGALRNDFFTPGRMFCMAIKTGNRRLM